MIRILLPLILLCGLLVVACNDAGDGGEASVSLASIAPENRMMASYDVTGMT